MKKLFCISLVVLLFSELWAGPGKIVVETDKDNVFVFNKHRGKGKKSFTLDKESAVKMIVVPEEECNNLLYCFLNDKISWIKLEPDQTITIKDTDKGLKFSGDNKKINTYLYEWTNKMYNSYRNALNFEIQMMMMELPAELRKQFDSKEISTPEYYNWIENIKDEALLDLKKAKIKDKSFIEEQTNRIEFVWLEMQTANYRYRKNNNTESRIPEFVNTYNFSNPAIMEYEGFENIINGYFNILDDAELLDYSAYDYVMRRSDRISDPKIKEYYILAELDRLINQGEYIFGTDKTLALIPENIFTTEGLNKFNSLKEDYKKLVESPNNHQGKRAFYFTFEDSKGGTVSLSDFRGKYILIDMWATWCGPCKYQIPFLVKLEEELHDRDIVFLSISTDKQENKGKWLEMIKEFNMQGVNVISPDAFNYQMFKEYNVTGIPRFMIINPDGEIVTDRSRRPSDPILKKQLIELLDEYESKRSQVAGTIKGNDPVTITLTKLGSMSMMLATEKNITGPYKLNGVYEEPAFASLSWNRGQNYKRTIVYIEPNEKIEVDIDANLNPIFRGKNADLNQMMYSLQSYDMDVFQKDYSSLKKQHSSQLYDNYINKCNAINASSLSKDKKNMLIGYAQGELLGIMYTMIISSKTFGKVMPKPNVSKDFSDPVLNMELIPEITYHYKWFESLEEFLYAKMQKGTVKIKGVNTYINDLAEGISNQELKERFIVQAFKKELLYGYLVGLEERIINAKSIVKTPAYITQLDEIVSQIPEAEKRYKNALPGTDLSDFYFTDKNGKEVSLKNYKGKYVFIDLWSTGCNPCIGEIPYIAEMEHKYKNKPIEWVSISLDTDVELWKKFLVDEKMKGIQLIAEKGARHPFMTAIGLYGIPHFLLLDKEGKVVNYNTMRPSNPVFSETLNYIMK